MQRTHYLALVARTLLRRWRAIPAAAADAAMTATTTERVHLSTPSCTAPSDPTGPMIWPAPRRPTTLVLPLLLLA